MVPDALQVADPFHLVKLANTKLDECRRRVQNETMGHRGRKSDPLYRCRRLLTKAEERLDDKGRDKLMGLLRAGDPKGMSPPCGRRRRRSASSTPTVIPTSPSSGSTRLGRDLQDKDYPIEARSSGAHPQPLEAPDRGVAPCPREQRTDGSGEQLDQASEACRLRLHQLPELPDPITALRREAQLGSARHRQTPVKFEEPQKRVANA